MKNIFRILLAALIMVGAVIPGKAEMYKYEQTGKGQRAQTAAGCTPSSSFEWLDINNVRTRINSGGDMWWDLPAGTGSKYFIPANGSATSLFAGSLWIAGVDVNNQLKCAALRFRQVGNDYYTGPLTVDGMASITPETCARWDKIFKITRAEVDEFLNAFDAATGQLKPDYQMPSIIEKWPATRAAEDPEGIAYYLAPFYDADGDGEYRPENGDYPYYDISNELCHTKIPTMEEELFGTMHGSILADQVLKGDQTLWWIFNDKGASHTESGGQAIGIEVRAQAFAFATNDEINNMTFYSYEIINRSTYTLTGTYFSPWTDVDLGYGWDDYVGCDVARGLGYGYNGSAVDGSGEPEAYGAQPPAIGIDFFQGPYMDPDGIDNPKYSYEYQQVWDPAVGDSVLIPTDSTQMVDESINGVNFGNGIIDDERFGMRRFVYHNNSSADNGDPSTAPQYYNYLRGIWKNGAKMRYGGNAFTGTDVVGPECDFMFPGDSDPWNWGTQGTPPNGGYNADGLYWSEEQCQNAPNDRRFMQSAGPFTLEPGAVNYITFGVPWARATSGGAWASVELLRVVDDKCQALFDNCFKVIDGPNAPDLTIRELDQELIIYLSNTAISNNYKEGYVEIDPEIPNSRVDTHIEYDTIWHECQVEVGGVMVDTLIPEVRVYETSEETFYDREYRFEGYKVYQLASDEVGADELSDTDKARLVFQCDIRNNVGRILNYEFDESLQANVPKLKVNGGDAGITHSFVITEDKFATGDNPNLVNHKTYYFMAVAYAYNNYLPYSQEPGIENGLLGQKKPYLEGRKNIQVYSAVPHKIVNGTVLRATYGDKPAITRLVGVGNGGNELELTQETIDEILSKPMANDSTNRFGSPNYPIAYHPKYEAGYGPIDVKIVDPLNVKSHRYELWFGEMTEQYTQNITGDIEVFGDSAARLVNRWYLRDLDEPEEAGVNPVMSDTTTIYTNEQMFIDRGISVNVSQTYDIGRIYVGTFFNDVEPEGVGPEDYHPYEYVVAPNNGVLTSSIEFEKPGEPWLDGIKDVDVPESYLNWIRSGTYVDMDHAANNDYAMSSKKTSKGDSKPWDPSENYEKLANRTWAPALLTTFSKQGEDGLNPGPLYAAGSHFDEGFKNTASIDVVLTADKSKWSRCPIIEMGMDKNLNEGGADRFFLRKHASVNQDGKTCAELGINPDPTDPNNPAFIGESGMGWFPGYVIDVETGARLNVAFGEDSYLADLNGRDMLFNPAKVQKATAEDNTGYMQMVDPAIYRGADGEAVFGGKHFVYVWRMDSIIMPNSAPWKQVKNYGYDGGQLLYNTMHFIEEMTNSGAAKTMNTNFYKLLMWVGMPMGIDGMEWLPEDNACRIRIRLAKPYAPGYGYAMQTENDDLNINNMNPKYLFTIEGWDPVQNDPEKTESDLNLVTVVPNPYYAYDSYEGNALTNKVKITNLPQKCVVSIYTMSGTKVRQFRKDNDSPNIDWDLTNFANTPVASGFYLIHIKDLTSGGERVIKFFGAMRQVDLNTF